MRSRLLAGIRKLSRKRSPPAIWCGWCGLKKTIGATHEHHLGIVDLRTSIAPGTNTRLAKCVSQFSVTDSGAQPMNTIIGFIVAFAIYGWVVCKVNERGF